MKRLTLLQRIFGDLIDVEGEIMESSQSYTTYGFVPVTVFSVRQRKGRVYHAGMNGHHDSPRVGDQVLMRVNPNRQIANDGEEPITRYKFIREYEIIQPDATKPA